MNYCINCKKELAKSSKYTHSTRCHSCVMKYLLKNNLKLINYLKNKFGKNNLITLCNQCNSRANTSRDYWKQKYQEKMINILTKNGGIPYGSL